MLRIILFLATNFAVLIVFHLVCTIFGIESILVANGINYKSLLVFSLIGGFAGSILSLLMSKTMAKRSMNVQIIKQPRNADEQWLISTVQQLANKAKIGMPEVGIYQGAPNAFATGASKNNALVAVSTEIMQVMTKEELEAVLGHEVSHVANGDMVTMTLLQGILNTFVIFFSRIVGYFVDSLLNGKNDNRSGVGVGYHISVFVFQMIFGLLASIVVAKFGRYREFRADAGAANLMGQSMSMIKALRRLQSLTTAELPGVVKGFGISGKIGSLMSTHPPLDKRITALQNFTPEYR